MSPDLSRYLSLRSPLPYIGLVLAASLGVSSYAWFDHITAYGDTVAGNVSFAGERMDGQTEAEVRQAVDDRANEVLSQEVTVSTPEGEIVLTAGGVGFSYDTTLAVDRIMAARHRGGPIDQFATWVSTLTTPIGVEEPVRFDPDAAMSTLAPLDGLVFEDPIEPGVEMNEDWRLQLIPGVPGVRADLDDLVDRIGDLDLLVDDDLGVSTTSISLPPEFTDQRATAVADEMNELTQSGARLIIGGDIRQMSPAAIRRHMSFSIDDDEMVPSFDLEGLQDEIEAIFPEPVGGYRAPTFEVDGEAVEVLVPGVPAEVCCSDGTAEKIAGAVLAGADGPFALTSRPDDDPVHAAWFDGSLVVEQVSTFTTPHNCCESRVTNIHQIADIVRGYYLLPGETLSLNGYVGPRTVEKGFVPAGAIRAGHHTAEVGGGVSQFATTIFNAAYFAGLEILEYRAHSEYFSRYPYGREATISNPAPDLVFENSTEYPILIWTSYTGTSVTVSMYSTKTIEVEQVATRSSKRNQCTYVETDRQRIFPDGHTEIDTFFALYRPAAGIDCNGNPIPINED